MCLPRPWWVIELYFRKIITKFLNLKRNNIVRVNDKDKSNISPKINNGNNNINYNINHLNNNKNQFSRIKIQKTKKSQIKSLLIPISTNHLINNNIGNDSNDMLLKQIIVKISILIKLKLILILIIIKILTQIIVIIIH